MKQRYPTTCLDQAGLPLPCPWMKQGTPFYPMRWNRNTLYYHIKWSRVTPLTTPWTKQGTQPPLYVTGVLQLDLSWLKQSFPKCPLGWNSDTPYLPLDETWITPHSCGNLHIALCAWRLDQLRPELQRLPFIWTFRVGIFIALMHKIQIFGVWPS